MDKSLNYHVKDISLAEFGYKNIEWAERQMGALLSMRARFSHEKPFTGVRIGIALHPTKETAVLVKTLIAGGADVALCACNPLSTQDDVVAALATDGVKVYAWKGQATEEYYANLVKVIEFKPHITIDDGCDLVTMIHEKYPELIPSIIGGCEETTTGVIRLHAMEKDKVLKYPMVAVNESKTKHLMDNIKGTGQSTIDGILRATNIILAGRTFVVLGYGNCGKGLARVADGMGARVIVTEVDAFAALQAAMDGFLVMPIADAAPLGDVFVTVTGNKNVIDLSHMKSMKDGAVLANSGHFDAEINITALKKAAHSIRQIRPSMEEYTLNGRKLFILAQGRLVNLAAAEGHPSSIMAMSFCNQLLACEFLVKNKGKLKAQIYTLPAEKDDEISKLQLESMGVRIDTLTAEQKAYLASWREGT